MSRTSSKTAPPLVLEVDAGRQRLDPALADRTVAAGERGEIRDAGHLEPDDERRVVRDPCASVSAKRTRTWWVNG
jgi:hypothetical protein